MSLIEAREARLIEAIKRGDAVDPLVAALKTEEERKKALAQELEKLTGLESMPPILVSPAGFEPALPP